MTQLETEFTPSAYPVPGRYLEYNGYKGNAEIPELETVDVISINKLDAYLSAARPAYYTEARLNSMTKNDKRYAHRIIAGADNVLPDV